jgi:mono/diheme cytochrome c family protein
MRRQHAVILASSLLASCPAFSQSSQTSEGEAVFNRHCIHCHGDSNEAPGTNQLARARGLPEPVLSKRTDLAGAYVALVVRNGLNAMPPFAPSHLTQSDLQALIAYLTRER